ncbi:MAG: response regulator [Ferruginibacter sp.]
MAAISIYNFEFLFNYRFRMFSDVVSQTKNEHFSGYISLADKAKFDSINILLADDDVDDSEIFKEALGEVITDANFQTVINGEQLLNFLKDATKLPDVIFLDLNMPLKNGLECLEEIRKNKKLYPVPIVIYSTTVNQLQVNNTFNSGANLYWQKPSDYNSIKRMMHKIFHFEFDNYIPKAMKAHFIVKE